MANVDRVNLVIVLFDDLNFAGKKQRQSFLPGNDPQRFIRSIQ